MKKYKFGKPINEIRVEEFDKYFSNAYTLMGVSLFSLKRLGELHGDKVFLKQLRMSNISLSRLIMFLIENGLLKEISFIIKDKKITYFSSKYFEQKNPLAKIIELVHNVYPKGYLSHYTAAFLNGLTEQVPQIIYINTEQRVMYDIDEAREDLSQDKIDRAFARIVTRGGIAAEVMGYKIRPTYGKDTGNLGTKQNLVGGMYISVTDTERTLIDITVRPELSGGLPEVISAYRNAKDAKKISIKKMIQYVKKINYVYPYHQSIGFLLEYVGYDANSLGAFKQEFENKFDFYLMHGPINTKKNKIKYFDKWNLYVPLDMI